MTNYNAQKKKFLKSAAAAEIQGAGNSTKFLGVS